MGIKQSGSEQAAQHSRSRSCCKVIINQHFRSVALRQMIVESHFQHEHHYVVWLIPSHFILFPIYLSTLRLKQQHTHLYIFVSVHNSQNTISYLLSLFELYFFYLYLCMYVAQEIEWVIGGSFLCPWDKIMNPNGCAIGV